MSYTCTYCRQWVDGDGGHFCETRKQSDIGQPFDGQADLRRIIREEIAKPTVGVVDPVVLP